MPSRIEIFLAGVVYAMHVGAALDARNSWKVAAAFILIPALICAAVNTDREPLIFWGGVVGMVAGAGLYLKGAAAD